jgi:PAS domain S-box-containing protein
MKKYVQTGIIILLASFMVGLILYVSYANYTDIQSNVIKIEQNQLLTLAETVSNSIESFFVDHQRDLEIISKNTSFMQDYLAFTSGVPNQDPWRNLNDYYQINKEQIESIGIVTKAGKSVYSIPITVEESIMEKDLANIKFGSENTIGKIYKNQGELFIHLYKPIVVDSNEGLVLYMRIRLLDIYRELVAPIKAGDKGYASVKDADGVLIMHPNTSDLGEEVLEARRSQYPDFDWSELEELVNKQKMGQSGVGIYHSLWFKDDFKTRVKKFSAYTPALVGDTFWIVNISKDYLEVVSFLKERTYTIIIVNFTILLLFVAVLMIYYRMNQDRKALKIQLALADEVLQLNTALEDDLRVRKSLEIELVKSKEWYESIFNSSSDYIMIAEIDDSGLPGHLLDANAKSFEILGYNKVEMSQLSFSDLVQFSDLSEGHFHLSKSILEEDQLFETCLCTKSGLQIPVEVHLKSFEGPVGKQCVIASRDISDKKAEEAAIKRSEERFRTIVQQVADRVLDFDDLGPGEIIISEDKERFASELEHINIKLEKLFKDEVQENQRKEALMVYQARLAAMGEMIGSIAHQWRQPLSVMQMLFSNVLDAYRHGELDEALLMDQHKRMLQLTKHMSETIDDFRYFFNPNADACDFLVSKSIGKSLSLLDDFVKQKGILVHMELKEDQLIRGYESQFSQVILSILQNSMEALQSSDISDRHVWIMLASHGNHMQITIKDTGGGVEPEHLLKLYDAHFSTKKTHHGTGLGLYIAKVIIEKNFNGKIESANGDKGLVTTIQMPLRGK